MTERTCRQCHHYEAPNGCNAAGGDNGLILDPVANTECRMFMEKPKMTDGSFRCWRNILKVVMAMTERKFPVTEIYSICRKCDFTHGCANIEVGGDCTIPAKDEIEALQAIILDQDAEISRLYDVGLYQSKRVQALEESRDRMCEREALHTESSGMQAAQIQHLEAKVKALEMDLRRAANCAECDWDKVLKGQVKYLENDLKDAREHIRDLEAVLAAIPSKYVQIAHRECGLDKKEAE